MSPTTMLFSEVAWNFIGHVYDVLRVPCQPKEVKDASEDEIYRYR